MEDIGYALTLIVHLDALDGHSALVAFTPGIQPEVLGLPELFGRLVTLIGPWLVAN